MKKVLIRPSNYYIVVRFNRFYILCLRNVGIAHLDFLINIFN